MMINLRSRLAPAYATTGELIANAIFFGGAGIVCFALGFLIAVDLTR